LCPNGSGNGECGDNRNAVQQVFDVHRLVSPVVQNNIIMAQSSLALMKIKRQFGLNRYRVVNDDRYLSSSGR
jgi:hypothetical protein